MEKQEPANVQQMVPCDDVNEQHPETFSENVPEQMTGYLHPDYAASLAEFGTPRELPACGGWILERQIPGLPYRDAMGCYPIFSCRDWSQLGSDIESLKSELVSIAVLVDPFGERDYESLRECFQHVVIPYKEHFVTDLSGKMDTYISSHNRRYARKALKEVTVEQCENPGQYLDQWFQLYSGLISRHKIKGIAAFSNAVFARQLEIPGIVVFRALHKGETVGMLLWYKQNDVAYYHLGAYSDIGYELRVSFALFWKAIEHFTSDQIRWLNLGAGAGVSGVATDGLSRFKRGWSTGTRTAYFCGRILDKSRYDEIANAKDLAPTDYFPAYRDGEFV